MHHVFSIQSAHERQISNVPSSYKETQTHREPSQEGWPDSTMSSSVCTSTRVCSVLLPNRYRWQLLATYRLAIHAEIDTDVLTCTHSQLNHSRNTSPSPHRQSFQQHRVYNCDSSFRQAAPETLQRCTKYHENLFKDYWDVSFIPLPRALSHNVKEVIKKNSWIHPSLRMCAKV